MTRGSALPVAFKKRMVTSMAYMQTEGRIAALDRLSQAAFAITLFAPELADISAPGQFVHLRCGEKPLRRPISICTIDRRAGVLRLVFEVRGEGTAWLAQRRPGEPLDVLGPLGRGFSVPEDGAGVVLVGGGIGTPPLLAVAQARVGKMEAILGFRNADACILAREFALACANVQLATDDGTLGYHGLVTDLLKTRLSQEQKPCAGIFACGPTPMLRAVAAIALEREIPCQVSLEERMGCGVGACLVCACKTREADGEHYRHVCKDGPVFDAKEVVW